MLSTVPLCLNFLVAIDLRCFGLATGLHCFLGDLAIDLHCSLDGLAIVVVRPDLVGIPSIVVLERVRIVVVPELVWAGGVELYFLVWLRSVFATHILLFLLDHV